MPQMDTALEKVMKLAGCANNAACFICMAIAYAKGFSEAKREVNEGWKTRVGELIHKYSGCTVEKQEK